jgi:lipopolysaccharide transport system permease protein
MSPSQFFRLIDVLARMSLRADASKYYLGYVWWILEPLLYVAVFYVVFNVILSSGRADFLVFLMCGKFPFVWFSKSVTQASNSIVSNVGLVGKVNVSKALFPLAVVQEGIYKQVTVFALLVLVLILNGYSPGAGWLMAVPVILVNYLMIVACALWGAIFVCFVRDFFMVISLGMIFLMFTSGIFWDVRALADPQMTEWVLLLNPIAFILDAYRQVLMYGAPVDAAHLLSIGLGALLLGGLAVYVIQRRGQLLALKALSA